MYLSVRNTMVLKTDEHSDIDSDFNIKKTRKKNNKINIFLEENI